MSSFKHKLEVDTLPRGGDCGRHFSCRSCVLHTSQGTMSAEVHSEIPEIHGHSEARQVEARVWANPSLNGPFEKALQAWGLKPLYERGQKAPAVELSQKGSVYKAECLAGMHVEVKRP
jgi:hypothetical protein